MNLAYLKSARDFLSYQQIHVVLALGNHKDMTAREISEVTGISGKTLNNNSMRGLKQGDLVCYSLRKDSRTHGSAHIYNLTDQGEKLVQMLQSGKESV